MESQNKKYTIKPRRKQIRKTPRKTTKHTKSKSSRGATKLLERKKNKSSKQKGGFKNCSLGYAMVKGMNVPAINNIEGELNFNDVYARLNDGSNCKLAENSINHPVLQTQ
jgi:hypothetical protein